MAVSMLGLQAELILHRELIGRLVKLLPPGQLGAALTQSEGAARAFAKNAQLDDTTGIRDAFAEIVKLSR